VATYHRRWSDEQRFWSLFLYSHNGECERCLYALFDTRSYGCLSLLKEISPWQLLQRNWKRSVEVVLLLPPDSTLPRYEDTPKNLHRKTLRQSPHCGRRVKTATAVCPRTSTTGLPEEASLEPYVESWNALNCLARSVITLSGATNQIQSIAY
jgi:hypothetical protein